MKPLIADMTQEDPQKRPTVQEVVSRFAEIRRGLSIWKLRSRVARIDEVWPTRVLRSGKHLFCTAGYILARKAAVPEPPP